MSCGLRASVLQCWGSTGDTTALIPVSPRGTVAGAPVAVPVQGAAVGLAINTFGGFVVTRAGAALGWGRNVEGQLGLGDTTDRTDVTMLPLDGWAQMAAGRFSSCGVRQGSVYCMGDNRAGQLGLGDTDRRSSPQVVSLR
jgi:hypothetical protein